MKKFYMIVLCFLFLNTALASDLKNQKGYQILKNLSYYDLLNLSKTKEIEGLQFRINNCLYTPIVDNTINPKPNINRKTNNQIGDYIRVTSWNIKKGFYIEDIKLLFKNHNKLIEKYGTKRPERISTIKKQAKFMNETDIFVLNEVDIGMPRTGYKNIALEFAKAINYNYAFATEFLEVDPVTLGKGQYVWSEVRFMKKAGLIDDYKVDKSKYKGIHGNAIVSRYPIKNVRIIRLPAYYDWYTQEKEKNSEFETIKRKITEQIFNEERTREIRLGSRCALLADIEIPNLDTPLTIIAIHLEHRTKPKNRAKQMTYLLNKIKHIKNPIIIAGDCNTLNTDESPTTIKREIKNRITDPHYLTRVALLATTPWGWSISCTRGVAEFFRRTKDPTLKNIPIIAPNQEIKLFNAISHFKFDDGYTFDFRGEKNLSSSNQRNKLGFVPSFEFKRDFRVIRYKLDWIFVKAYAKSPYEQNAPEKLAPHFGETFYDLIFSLNKNISSHAPISVVLPLNNYKKKNLITKKHNTPDKSRYFKR